MTFRGNTLISTAALAALTLAACSSGGAQSTPSPATGSSATGASASAGASPSGSSSASPSASAAPMGRMTPVAPPASAQAVADDDELGSGVVRVQVDTCTGMTQTSGSFVADDLVLTVNHSLAGASSIAVHSAGGVVRGQVVAQDAQHDLAIIKVLPTGDGARLSGHVFALGTPANGAAVTMLGHPTARHLYSDAGRITGLGDRITHTANAAPGTSGGPLLDASQRIVGVEIATNTTGAGAHTAASAVAAPALLSKARTAPSTPKLATCPIDGASITSIHPDAPAIRGALARYVLGLASPTTRTSTGRTGLEDAWQTLSDAQQKKYGTPAAFQASFKGSHPSVANVDNLEVTDWFTDTLVWTIQFEGPGKACQVHQQKVVLSSAPGTWVIDQVTEMGTPRAC